MVKKSWS